MISAFSNPDPRLLELSSNTLRVCRYQGTASLRVVKATSVQSVVAMAPFSFSFTTDTLTRISSGGRSAYKENELFYMAEKIGLEVLHLAGVEDSPEERDEED